MSTGTSRSAEAGPSRRAILTAGLAVGGGLLVGFRLGFPRAAAAAGGTTETFAPDAFIRISENGQVAVVVPFVEMGQGTYTSVPMLVAEELEVGLDQVQVEHAPADEKRYAHPIFKAQVTGGSGSIRGAYEPMRRAGATARVMLVTAAATSWGVNPDTCRAERGWVIHPPSNRRVTYGSVASAAAQLPVPERVVLKDPKDFKLIGTPAKRLDTPDKVRGKAKYGIDVRVPGMRIAAVAACPVFGGKLASVDDTGAKAVRGVQEVVRIENAVAVVADHTWAARKGLAALKITWDPGPNAGISTADVARDFEAASRSQGIIATNEGDVDAARPVRTLEAFYEMPFLAHAAMEPLSCTIHARKDGCDIWVGTQAPSRGQEAAAKVLGLSPEKVRVHNHLLGGGFGRRLEHDWIEQAARFARQIDGPVKLTWSRAEDMQHDAYRSYNCSRVSAGLDREGMPVTFRHRVVGPAVMARFLPLFFRNGVDLDAMDDALGPYFIPNVRTEFVRKEPPDGMLVGNWRGVGPTRNVFVVEGFIDELAHAAHKDPVAYRRTLLQKSPRGLAVLELAARNAGWGKPLPPRSGRGVAVYSAMGTYIAEVAEVSVEGDGRVRVRRVTCAVDCGQVINPDTVKAQIEGAVMYGLGATLHGPITLKNGRVEQGNFDTYPVPRMNEAPSIDVELVASREAPGGIGEPGTSGLAPAVVNAVFAATGKRLRTLPIDRTALKIA